MNAGSMAGHGMLPGPAAGGGNAGLELASSNVDKSLASDSNYQDLVSLLQVVKHTQPTLSGLLDKDYPSLADARIGLDSMSLLSTIKRVPLPAELVEQFGHMQCNCLMGLFLEISRAWLAIDSDIFVWNYQDGSDLAYFDGLSETILSAGLVRPKAGIFQPHISHLLVLTTPVDIVLLGVSFSKPHDATVESGAGEMHLLPEPLFTVPTDNVHMMSVCGSQDGRIFMAGKDGHLYELYYQAEDGWFSRKCRKIDLSASKLSYILPSMLNFTLADDSDPMVQLAMDDSRHILYTRSEKGTMQVWDLGEDGKSVCRVATVSQHTTLQNAANIARTIDRSNFKSIIHIAAIQRSESVSVHLVAITNTGARLYFAACPVGATRERPSMLSLIHVRLAPGFAASAGPNKPNNVHLAHYARGMLLLSCVQSEDSDLLWSMSPDCFPFTQTLMETQEVVGIAGRTWALAEVPMSGEESPSDGPLQRADPPLVVTQHLEPPRQFVILNSQGSCIVNKLSPADQLKQLLLTHGGPEAQQVQAFFKLHKEEQACATCLILACSHLNAAEPAIADWATQAFFMYGGEPRMAMQASLGGYGGMPAGMMSPGASGFDPMSPGFNPSMISTPYPGGQPGFSSPMNIGQQEVQYSGKHNGLCLYLARILRPLWEQRLVSDSPCRSAKGKVEYLASSVRSEELSWYLEQLKSLKDFMDRNSQFTSPILADSCGMNAHGADTTLLTHRPEPHLDRAHHSGEISGIEKSSLHAIHELIHRLCECLSLWKILCDHQFHIIAEALTQDQQNQLKTLSFKNFVTTGKEIASALIQCLICRYLSDNAATDAISSRLREVCSSLYSSDDAVCSKANELLTVAKTTQSKGQKDGQLKEALQLYKQIPGQLELSAVCMQFGAVHFYAGIVDLSLTAAAKQDPQGLAEHFYRNGEPQEDLQGMHAYINRKSCYRCITETLEHLLSTSLSHPQAPSVPTSPGPPPPTDPNRMTTQAAQQYTDDVFSLCLKSDDELFHVHLYDWLVSHNLTEKLLDIHSAYLEPYLKRSTQVNPEHAATLDLLWRYYEKTQNYTAAAKILAKLADRHSIDVSLSQRLEYLSRATMSAKSATSTAASSQQGEFLHELEEKMEVARLQLQIFDSLTKLGVQHCISDSTKQEALSRLNSELLDITTLYGEFADTFNLAECKLAIIQCAGHYDPTLIEALWQNIIDNELSVMQTSSVETRMEILQGKLVSMGRMYANTERYFPVAFLVRYLELKSCSLSFDKKFVFLTLQEVGVSVSKLLEIYDRLVKSKESCWHALRQPFHLLRVICAMLSGLVDKPTLVPSYERRPFVTTCLDAVTSYLVELQASSSTDSQLPQLMADFKNLQARLERTI